MRAYVFKLTLLLSFVCLTLACSESRASVVVHFENPDGSSSPKVQAELASTDSQRNLGLMYRKDLTEQQGMLFLFPEEAGRSFWMKNTYLELDIIFLNKDFQVVSIIERAVPLSETGRLSEKPAQYVLEIVGGLSERWGVKKGSRLKVQGSLPTPR